MLARAARSSDEARRTELRDQAVELCLPLADHVAQHFAGRGEPFDDLVQVARVGVVNACDRFDPDRDTEFLSFAVPTVMGEVRRYFRDNTWTVRVSRRAKDTAQAIARGADELIQTLGRSPRPSELATHLDLPLDEVVDGLLARSAYSTSSLDSPMADDGDGGRPLKDSLGTSDRDIDRVSDFLTVREAMKQLPERERTVIALRFFRSMSQSEIAAELGISQMHVSRLLSATLRSLRDAVGGADDHQ
nr:SigB/SigF/SigG family RNA polymerase sigma factor [Gordonia araii]